MKRFLWFFACLAIAGCDGDPCTELAEICERCPPDGDGPVARESCRKTAAEGTEEDCQARIDEGTYAARGCQ